MEPVAEDPLQYMAEESKPEWHWNFSEEDVRVEREEGLARIETARAHFRAQETVVRNINSKLQEQDSAPTYAPSSLQAFMLGVMGGSGAGSRAGSASQALSYGSSVASPEQQRSALVVADNIIRRQERVLESDRLRREVLEREEQSRGRTMAELEAADTRCARKQELILQEQRRKAFAAQQRRSEQQKVARELQRDQIKMREAYYAKTSPSRSSGRQQAERPQTTLSASSAIPQYSSEPNMEEEETSFNQDILKHTQRSHSMYAGTMDRWNKFVNENERRTEAYWRKMLGSSNLDRGGDRRKGRGRRAISSGAAGGQSTPSKRATDGRKACLSEGGATGLVEGDEFLTRDDFRKSSKRIPVSVSAEGSPRDYSPWASPTNEQRSASKRPLKHSSTTQALPTMSLGSRETSPAQISAAKTMGSSSPVGGFYKPPQAALKRMSLPALPSLSLRDTKRATRVEVVETELQRLQEKKEQQAKENKKEMEQRLARITKERTDKIQKRNQLWEERYNQAAKRKSVSLAAYEAELLRKHEENSQKRAGSASRQREDTSRERGGELIDKVTLARNVQKAARLFKEKTAELAKKQIAEKEAAAMQNYQARLGGLSDQDRREKHVEQTRLAAERKRQLESEFRSKAQGEIAKKAAKSADVIGHQSRRPLEQQRSRLKAKGARRSSSDSPPARHSPPLVPTEFPIDFDPAELDLLQEQRSSLSSAGSDDMEDKTAFLKELQEKSNGWLRDMRSPQKEKDVQPWKPF